MGQRCSVPFKSTMRVFTSAWLCTGSRKSWLWTWKLGSSLQTVDIISCISIIPRIAQNLNMAIIFCFVLFFSLSCKSMSLDIKKQTPFWTPRLQKYCCYFVKKGHRNTIIVGCVVVSVKKKWAGSKGKLRKRACSILTTPLSITFFEKTWFFFSKADILVCFYFQSYWKKAWKKQIFQ